MTCHHCARAEKHVVRFVDGDDVIERHLCHDCLVAIPADLVRAVKVLPDKVCPARMRRTVDFYRDLYTESMTYLHLRVTLKVIDIGDYTGDVTPPEGATAAIIMTKGWEQMTPVFVRPGCSVEITDLLMGRQTSK